MNARVAAVLVALLVVLGGGAVLYYQQGRSQKPAASGMLGQPLLKGLKAADIAAISIREPKAALTLERKTERWTIAERAGFPADFDRVRDLVVKTIGLKIGQAEPLAAPDRTRLNLDESGTRVEFRDADGKALARLVVGRKYFKSEPENADKAPGDGRFVLLPESDSSVYIVSDPLAQATTKTSEWIARTGFAAEKVKTLEVKPAQGEGWRIERARDNADWRLAGARAGEKLEIARANAAAYLFSSVELADVAPKDAKPENTGLAKPTVITATTFEGLTYTLKVGRPEGDNYYATITIAGAPKPEGKDAEERLKKLDERLPREKALAEHVLLIGKSKLEDVLKKRSELLAKKEQKK